MEEVQLLEPEESWINETEKYLEEELDSEVVKERIEILAVKFSFQKDTYPSETVFLLRHWSAVEKLIKAGASHSPILHKWAEAGVIKEEYWDYLVRLYIALTNKGPLINTALPCLANGGMFDYLDEHFNKIISDLKKMNKTKDHGYLFINAFPILAENGFFKTYYSWKKVSSTLIRLSDFDDGGLSFFSIVFPTLAKCNLLKSLDKIEKGLVQLRRKNINYRFFYLLFNLSLINDLKKAQKDLINIYGYIYGESFFRVLCDIRDSKLLVYKNWKAIKAVLREVVLGNLRDKDYTLKLLRLYIKGKIKLDDIGKKIRKDFKFKAEKKVKIPHGKKYYVKSLNDYLTLKEIKMILDNELPVVFYHATRGNHTKAILNEGALMPLYRLQFKHLISYFNQHKEKTFSKRRVEKVIKLRVKQMETHLLSGLGKQPFEIMANDIFEDKKELTGEEIVVRLFRLMKYLYSYYRCQMSGCRKEYLDKGLWAVTDVNKVRDRWAVCLVKEHFNNSLFSGVMKDYVKGLGWVFEIKPSFHYRVKKPVSQASKLDDPLTGGDALEYIAEKRIPLKEWVCAIYLITRKYTGTKKITDEKELPPGAPAPYYKEVEINHVDEIKKLLKKYGYKNIPILLPEDQPKRIKQIRQELQSILDKAKGKVKEPVEVKEMAA